MSENNFRQELLRQARELIFNRGGDAAALAFREAGGGGEGEGPDIREMDLSALTSIHRTSNGSVELKFIDRIKLIELLLDAGDDRRRAGEGDGFILALDRAARRLGDGEDAGAGPDSDAAGTGAGAQDAGGRGADGGGEGQGRAEAQYDPKYAAGEFDLERERRVCGGFGRGYAEDGDERDGDGAR